MKATKEIRIHGHEICPIYGEEVLPNEWDRCSLCDRAMDETLVDLIDALEKQAFQNGHDSAVHHISLYKQGNVLVNLGDEVAA